MVAILGEGFNPTGQQLRLVAEHASIVISQPHRMARIGPQLQALNPHLVFIIYENGMLSTPSDPSGLPSPWFLHSAGGQEIIPAQFPSNRLMDPLSTTAFTSGGVTYHGWADYVADECLRDQLPFTSGCYLDALGIGPLQHGYALDELMPELPAEGRTPTVRQYEALTTHVATVVRHALPAGDTLLANGYRNGEEYFAGTQALNRFVSGVQAQGWLTENASRLTLAAWKQNAQMVPDASASTHPLLRYTCSCTGGDTQAQLQYGLATYLLVNTGHAFFDFQVGNVRDFQDWSRLYDLNLGQPLVTHMDIQRYFHGGVYQRPYQHGLVIVNPGTRAVQVPLQRAYFDPGGQRVRSVTVPPRGSALLTT